MGGAVLNHQKALSLADLSASSHSLQIDIRLAYTTYTARYVAIFLRGSTIPHSAHDEV